MNKPIAYTKPSITELEVSYATDAVRHGWGPRCYEYIERFESDVKYAMLNGIYSILYTK